MTKRGKAAGASGHRKAPAPVRKADPAEQHTQADGDAREAFDEETATEGGPTGEAMETRVRNRKDERLHLDALDDRQVSMERDDLPADAVDEIAMSEVPEDYETTDSGARRPKSDDAEMGFGSEAHSPEDIVDQVLGKEPPGRRGTTREGEAHGPHLGLE